MNTRQRLPLSLEMGTVWALALAAAIVPLLFIPLGIIPFTFTKTAFVAFIAVVALILFILTRLRRGSLIIPPMAVVGLMWLIPLSFLVSTLFSGSTLSRAFFGGQLESTTLGFVLAVTVLATLSALALRRAEHLMLVARAGLVGFGIVLGFQLLVLIASTGIFSGLGITADPSFNLIGGIADFAIFLSAGVIGMLIALQQNLFAGRSKVAVYVMLGVSLCLLALLNYVLAWIALGLFALASFIQSMFRQSGDVSEDVQGVRALYSTQSPQEESSAAMDMTSTATAKSSSGLVLSLVVLAASLIFVVGSGSIGNLLAQTFGTDQIAVSPSWQATLQVGEGTYASNLFFGSGPATFAEQWLMHKPEQVNETLFWDTAFSAGVGYVPTVVATTGIIGALAWLAFFAGFIFFGLKGIFTARSGKKTFALSLLAFVMSTYLWIMAVAHVASPVLLVLAFISTGFFVSTLRFAGTETREWGIFFARSPRIGFALVFILTLLLLGSIVVSFFVGERYLAALSYNQALQAAQQGDRAIANQALSQALTLAPADRHYRLASALGQADINRILNDESLSQEEARAQFQEALSRSVESALLSTRIDENDFQNWLTLGNVYQTVVPLNVEGAYDNARVAYERARELNPSSPRIPLILAQLEIAQENPDAARTFLEEAITLKQNYVDAIFLLSQLEVQEGNTQEALESAEAAVFFQQNNPNLLFQLGLLRQATNNTDGAIAVLERAVAINPEFANARFVLASLYAEQEEFEQAIEELEFVAGLSEENSQELADEIEALSNGENPFPSSVLEGEVPVEE